MKELWTGRVELLTPQTEWGDTKCFTNVFVWADDAEDFAKSVARHLDAESISLIQIEESHRLKDGEEMNEQIRPFWDWVKEDPERFTTTDRHYYPSQPN